MVILLTPIGKQKAESGYGGGGGKDAILSHLLAAGPADTDDLGAACNLNDRAVDGYVRGLLRDGLVRESGAAQV